MYSPTTSPYGYSSFPKEEILDTIDFLVSPYPQGEMIGEHPSPKIN